MALDKQIIEAIKVAVEESGQSSDLANKFIAWMEALASGNEEVGDRESGDRHLNIIYKETN